MAAEVSSGWNFYHTLGAIDGKHVTIRCPRNGRSLYNNYKGFHSIILFTLVDAYYKFMWVDVGVTRSNFDVHIFNQLQLRAGIIDGCLQVPAAEPLPGDDGLMPYFIIEDDALSLCMWLMKPFSGCIVPDTQRIF